MQYRLLKEGGNALDVADVTLNGQPYLAGMPCGLGWKTLVVHAPDFEPFETNCFVWYGGVAFGNITLARTRGRMELDFSPAAKTVQIIGSAAMYNLTNITHESLSPPTGRYTVQAKYMRFAEERTVEVTRNQTSRVAIAPSMSTLNLSSDPDNADFTLNSKGPPGVSVRGSTPATITDLPAGEYELAIARADYRKILPVRLIGTKSTNELEVEFRYAKLSIISEPTDAAISDGSRVVGRTPASFKLKPGAYRFQVIKDGYFGTNVELSLSETDARTVSVALANVSYVEAIERAQRRAPGGIQDDRALADLEQALKIKPGDETALALKREIEFDQHLRKARRLQINGVFAEALSEIHAALKLNASDAEALAMKNDLEEAQRAVNEQKSKVEQAAATARAEARRNRPQKVLQDVASRFRHNELFEAQAMRFNGSLDAVRAGVVRALGRKPAWSIVRDDRQDADTLLLLADAKGFGWKQNVVLVVGQTADNEVVVTFKLFAFILGGNIQLSLSGVSEDSYQPKHPRYASPPSMASVLEKNLSHDTQEFKKRIEEELR
jgi:PEGA domain